MEQLTEFGRELSKICIEMGINRRKMAGKLGFSHAYIYNITNGHNSPTNKFLRRLIAVYPELKKRENEFLEMINKGSRIIFNKSECSGDEYEAAWQLFKNKSRLSEEHLSRIIELINNETL